MKHITVAALLLISLFSCKKETPNTPDPATDIPEWTLFNTLNSPLPDNQINALAIDKQDVKWIGTSKGLIRWEGNKWKVFNCSNSPLPSDYVQSLAVEDNGTLWAGTAEGLIRLSGDNWQVYTTANSSLTHKGIPCIAHDAQRKITYVGTEGSIIKISAGNRWDILLENDNPVLSLAVDRNGLLWAGQFNFFAFVGRIGKYENGQWASFNLATAGYPSSFPYSLAIDNNNKPVVALSGTAVRTVVHVNGQALEEIPYSSTAGGIKVLLAEADKIWLGGDRLSMLGNRDHPSFSIPGTDSPIQAIAIDSKGNKWLGTLYSGVVRYHAK
ncbi:MAG: ligand-binding sensor domain-containing protein [Chitinophagaceae bacterium]